MAAHNILVTPAPLDETGPEGPLYGVPVTVKDCFETAGLRSTAGHPPLTDHVPAQDAAMVARLRQTGAVILGKTNLAQLCGDVQTDNPIFGRTDNPWDASRTAGGSGGGGAAAVAWGLSRLELGSDVAGSLRIPAGFCGVAALKPGQGRLPMQGHIPPLPGTNGPDPMFGVAGLIARDSTDLAQGWHALTAEPPASAPQSPLSLAFAGGLGLPLCPRTAMAMTTMQDWLTQSGHSLSRATIDHAAAWAAYGTLLTSAAAPFVPFWQRALLHLLRWVTPGRPIRSAMINGLTGSSADDARALQAKVAAQIDTILAQHNALLCPVTATAAFAHAPKPRSYFASRKIQSGARALHYLEAGISMTSVFSLTGHPVVVVPLGLFDGLPVGVQIIMPQGQEAGLLALSTTLEAIFATHRPPLWQSLADRKPLLQEISDDQ
jgi:amidase